MFKNAHRTLIYQSLKQKTTYINYQWMGKLSMAYVDKRILLSNKKRTNNNMRESHRHKDNQGNQTQKEINSFT